MAGTPQVSPLLHLLFLYLAFRLKQFLCDFVLQTAWMANTKGKPGTEGWRALGAHCGVHGIGTLAITLIFAPSLWFLGIIDFFVHAGIDRLKTYMTYKHSLTPQKSLYWIAFALDQEAHNLTHLAYIISIVMSWQVVV